MKENIMKKYISLLMLAAAFSFAACDVETDIEPGGTSVEKMAGRWTVTVDMLDANDNVLAEDIMGERIQMSTYNTASNTSTEMWIDDGKSFWDYKLKVDVDYAARTFTTNGQKENTSYDCMVTIDGGKVLEGAATTPSGAKADSIVFYVSFSDDDDPTLKYKVSGFRYTGFSADL